MTALARFARGPLLPLMLLVAQLVVVYVQRSRVHEWRPARVPDSKSYVEASRATTFTQAVSHYRTFGYPLFLKTLRGLGVSVDRVPTIQFALFGSAVIGLWLGLLLYTGSPWLAFAGATPLPWGYVVDLMPEIMTDPLAASLTLTAAALVLALATRPSGRLLWVALAITVFAAYQVRPASVFLIGWVPLTAAVLRVAREGRLPPRLHRWAVGIAAVTFVPYLAFAGARWLTVGHFGLVSFGGTNLAGVAANFLDEQVVAELAPERRPLAASMLKARQRRGWEPMTPGADTRIWFLQYSDNIFKVSLRASAAQLRREDHRWEEAGVVGDTRPRRIRRNEMLNDVSRAIIRARPRLYLQWVRDSFLYGLRSLAQRPWVVWPAAALVVSALALLVRRRRVGALPAGAGGWWMLAGLAFLPVSYFLLYLSLLALVSWPFPRYFAAMILFLPSALCLAVFEIWRRILGGRRPA